MFNPSHETARLIGKAMKIGPLSAQLAREIFAHLGRPGQKAIYGLTNLPRHHGCEDIERACQQVVKLSRPSYQALKRSTAAKQVRATADKDRLQQHGDHIRALEEYQRFFDQQTSAITDPENTPELQRALRALRLSGMIATLEARAMQVQSHQMNFLEALLLARTGRT